MEIVYTAERYGVGGFGERRHEWLVWWMMLCSVVVAIRLHMTVTGAVATRGLRWDEETGSSFATT